jgi:SWI/SNF-related matrix-associated actin-dependent regulator of chromatin subfamily D
LHYTVNAAVPPPDLPSAWDIEVKIEDASLRGRMNVMIQNSKESAQELAKLDEEVSRSISSRGAYLHKVQIALHVQSLHNSHLKRTFLESFANDPAQFIQTWLESQSRDLESVLGSGPSEGGTIRAEDLHRSDYFKLPWVEEAIAVQEGTRLAAKGMQ